MKKLEFIKPEYVASSGRWEEDVIRIVDICYLNGYRISSSDARAAWEEYSDSLAACWLTLSNNDKDVLEIVLQYCKITGE